MRLIGMLDSPYVRRVAVSLRCVGLPFDHEAVSVFRHYERFSAINPVVKAPTLVTDDGVTLMDSTLILDYAGRLAPDRRLSPTKLNDYARAQRMIGLALAATDKSVQFVYELTLRPAEKQHQPWLDRVQRQVLAAYRLLEAEIGSGEAWLFADRPLLADISVAVAWHFTQAILPDLAAVVVPGHHPALTVFSQRAEALPEFRAFPHA